MLQVHIENSCRRKLNILGSPVDIPRQYTVRVSTAVSKKSCLQRASSVWKAGDKQAAYCAQLQALSIFSSRKQVFLPGTLEKVPAWQLMHDVNPASRYTTTVITPIPKLQPDARWPFPNCTIRTRKGIKLPFAWSTGICSCLTTSAWSKTCPSAATQRRF